jgi:biotin carboxylase
VSTGAPHLLVLGAGRESLPVLRALHALGCHLAVLDGVPSAPGFRSADAGLLASTFDEEATIEAVRAYAARAPLDGVLGTTRRVATAVALAAEALGLPGASLGAARLVADRLATKARLRDAGVPVPWCARVCGPAALRQIRAATTERLVVKPVDGWAARGVVRLLDGVDLAWAQRVALLSSPSARAMVEAYTEGLRLSVIALVAHGAVTVVDVAERAGDAHERFAPFLLDAGHDRPAMLSSAQHAAVEALLGTSIHVLGVDSAVVTGEVVLGRRGPLLVDLELGLVDGRRLTHEIPLATGIDVMGSVLRLTLGEALGSDALMPRWRRPVAERAVFASPGTVVMVCDAERAAEGDGVTLVDMLVGPGGRVPPPTSNMCHGGAVVATGESREQAVARASAAAQRISVVTADGSSASPVGH